MAGKNMDIASTLGKFKKSQLLLPIAALVLMLIVNVIITPDFFKISINNGVLYLEVREQNIRHEFKLNG